MALKASEISTLVRERRCAGYKETCPRYAPQARSGYDRQCILPCLLIGLLFLTFEIRTIFSDQPKQEYSRLVLEGIERAESARSPVRVWQQWADNSNTQSEQPEGYRRARLDLAPLVNASPVHGTVYPSIHAIARRKSRPGRYGIWDVDDAAKRRVDGKKRGCGNQCGEISFFHSDELRAKESTLLAGQADG